MLPPRPWSRVLPPPDVPVRATSRRSIAFRPPIKKRHPNDEHGCGPLDAREGPPSCRSRRRRLRELVRRMELDGSEGDTVKLSVPTRFLKSWIQSHYAERVLACWQAEQPTFSRVELTVRSAVIRTLPPKIKQPECL